MIHLIFDTETSGLPKNWNSPMTDSENWPRLVSLSWILSDGVNHKEFDFIIKPVGFEISPEVAEIHGITQERALAEGFDLELVLALFMTSVDKSNKIVAHNLKFDTNIVGAELCRIGRGEMFDKIFGDKGKVDTMLDWKTQLGFTKWPKLMELHNRVFGEGFDGAHNSLFDTRACAKCYFELIKQ